jgi:uncharacterized protein (UPF0548 family)
VGELMVSLRRPSPERIRQFLASQSRLGYTYAAVGATGGQTPAGYVLDRTRTVLGQGESAFARARTVLERWGQFDLGWVEAWPPETPLRDGAVVAVLARLSGLWWLSACRIVNVIDETGPITRFGFAYGTLPDHAGSGEERFLLEWDHATGEVSYEILAFSRPRWLIARLVYPYMRSLQRRFGRESAAAMRRAVRDAA